MLNVEEESFHGGPDKLHKEWRFTLEDTPLVLQRYGNFCQWNKILLLADSKEVYRIALGGRTRRELFFDEQLRVYDGDQFSFVEYLWLAIDKESLPTKDELTAKGLESKFAVIYDAQGRKITRKGVSQQTDTVSPDDAENLR